MRTLATVNIGLTPWWALTKSACTYSGDLEHGLTFRERSNHKTSAREHLGDVEDGRPYLCGSVHSRRSRHVRTLATVSLGELIGVRAENRGVSGGAVPKMARRVGIRFMSPVAFASDICRTPNGHIERNHDALRRDLEEAGVPVDHIHVVYGFSAPLQQGESGNSIG